MHGLCRYSQLLSHCGVPLMVALMSLLSTSTLAEEYKGDSLRLPANNALERLSEGNRRFAEGQTQHPHESLNWRAALEQEQHPFAIVLGCADSRVPPELIFDQGFGDLFVIRVAGNIVDTDVIGSIEYGTHHLHVPLIVVLGHTNCGAVTAAVNHLSESDGEPDEIVSLLYRIEPAVVGLDEQLNRKSLVRAAVEKNVRLSVRRLSHVPVLMKGLKKNKLRIVGGIYDMHSGKVRFLDEP